MNDRVRLLSRRQALTAGAMVGVIAVTDDAFSQQGLAPTPACHDGDESTMPQIEGPYFKPRSPRRSDLREPGMAGRPIELSGVVLTRRCRPIAGVLVDLWHADDNGVYDEKGFRLRGHVFTDASGRYAFRTIVPGLYPGRTRHFHAKIQAPKHPVLTTQFYFPDEARNRSDEYFTPELVMGIASAGDGLQARYDVMLALR